MLMRKTKNMEGLRRRARYKSPHQEKQHFQASLLRLPLLTKTASSQPKRYRSSNNTNFTPSVLCALDSLPVRRQLEVPVDVHRQSRDYRKRKEAVSGASGGGGVSHILALTLCRRIKGRGCSCGHPSSNPGPWNEAHVLGLFGIGNRCCAASAQLVADLPLLAHRRYYKWKKEERKGAMNCKIGNVVQSVAAKPAKETSDRTPNSFLSCPHRTPN